MVPASSCNEIVNYANGVAGISNGANEHVMEQVPPLNKLYVADSDVARATELADAEEVHQRFGGDLRYDTGRKKWMVWNGNFWAVDESFHVPRKVIEVAKAAADRLGAQDANLIRRHRARAESASGVASVVKLLEYQTGISVPSNVFDRETMLLPVGNGTIDLKTGALGLHERKHLFTRGLSVEFNPAAECPKFLAFIDRIMGGDSSMVAYLQKILGLCLTGCPNVQELYIFHGQGANGKSTLLDLVMWLLESFASPAPESLLVTKKYGSEHPTELAMLQGKRLVVASETESSSDLRLQLVKRLTGDAMITARVMRGDFFEFLRTHKMILMSNNKPNISEQTEAAWRRIRLVPFDVVISAEERDPLLLDKLKAESPGILNWVLAGCLVWQKDGMTPPAKVSSATAEYKAESDLLIDYLNARCVVKAGVGVHRVELYTAYVNWAKDTAEPHPLTRKQFYDLVRKVPGVTEEPFKHDGKWDRGFHGIKCASLSDIMGDASM